MSLENIKQTEIFLKETFAASPYLQANPGQAAYRLEHSYRVANIARQIAIAEGLDADCAVMAGLLHDISYRDEMQTREQRRSHGRAAAHIARPFLDTLDLSEQQRGDILYGIAIHVDDQADFDWPRTAFAETVSDADNIDRFDAYRIYEKLLYDGFQALSLADKRQRVSSMLEQLPRLREMQLGTKTAQALWLQRLDFYIAFYERLKDQLANSDGIL